MSRKFTKSQLKEKLIEAGIEDKPVLREVLDTVTKKPKLELINYNKIMVKFLMLLPDELRDKELERLEERIKEMKEPKTEVEEEVTYDSIKEKYPKGITK